ncbi:hypothetical protein CXB51_025942 [Gossypium anomalum]|uniref:Vesicle-fusing ATPase n=1 Tax=Gossypium anomalum TaxID=47600 RepID=A0A8J5Z4L7_9ROSI|nr:hypothetical protein CXB51_025942 [Gossypium anomalum]
MMKNDLLEVEVFQLYMQSCWTEVIKLLRIILGDEMFREREMAGSNEINLNECKIVNGPEVLSKFVGETEKNVRDLFADPENDQRTRVDESDLHVIIFDEIDAICTSRGSTRDGTEVHDSIVNQLLTKIDVESLSNVLLIGMTNRNDLLDEALLSYIMNCIVQVEISLPDENSRLQILQIHTNKMKENSFLAPDVNLQELGMFVSNLWLWDLHSFLVWENQLLNVKSGFIFR